MGLIQIILEKILSRLIGDVEGKNLERIRMKLKRKYKVSDLSLAAGELIVAVLENGGSALKMSSRLCVAIDRTNAPFISAIPQSERASDDEIVEELCDRGLLCPYNDKIFRATDKARKLADALKRLDETRIFVYAPNLVKAFFPIMAVEGATLRVQGWNVQRATAVAKIGGHFQARNELLRDVEFAVEYLYREKLIENLRFVDLEDRKLIGLTINAGLSIQSAASLFGDAIPVRIAADFTERARRVARIDLGKLGQDANKKKRLAVK